MRKSWSKLVLSLSMITFLMGIVTVPATLASAAPTPQSTHQMASMMDKDKMMCMMQSSEMKPMMMGMMKDMMMSPEMKPMMMDMMKEMMQSPEMSEMMMNMMQEMMSKHAVDTAPQQPVDHSKHQ